MSHRRTSEEIASKKEEYKKLSKETTSPELRRLYKHAAYVLSWVEGEVE